MHSLAQVVIANTTSSAERSPIRNTRVFLQLLEITQKHMRFPKHAILMRLSTSTSEAQSHTAWRTLFRHEASLVLQHG
jgi:hypothetical protein